MTIPLSSHRTVLLEEAVFALAIQPDGCYVDCTFGRGGHSRAILKQLGSHGRLIVFDKDPQAIEVAKTLAETDSRVTVIHEGFSQFSAVLAEKGISFVHGVLMDLGVSSPQIDTPERGFSFRFDAPLDMRMDCTRGQTAAEWLASAEEKDIAEVIKEYGEERFARKIAASIVETRKESPLERTRQLAQLVAKAVRSREQGQDPATRTFQAIRIFINRELEELSLTLPAITAHLAPSGRLAVISFHSLEDRIVKQFMKAACLVDHLPHRLPIKAADLPPAEFETVGKALRPTAQEVADNPRARSAILRVLARRSH